MTVDDVFDLCIIGCGPSGFAAASRALDFGKKVCIIEKSEIGGAGLMHGALTSKAMWELSKDYAGASRVDRGYRASSLTVNYNSLKDTVIQAAKEKQYQMFSQIETYSKEKNKEGSLTYIKGEAKFRNNKQLEITQMDGRQYCIHTENTVISTGSRPRIFPNIEIDHKRILNSNDILSLKKLPERIMIVGAGIIGCEYATIFSNYGCQVFLLDRADTIIPFEDPDISKYVAENLTKNGVRICHKACLKSIENLEKFQRVVVDYTDGHSEVIEVDVTLVCIGRVPNVEEIGLENIAHELAPNGRVKVDSDCLVSKGVYAVGDCNDQGQPLVNVAEMEGRHAVEHMYQEDPSPIRYKNMSTLMFFKPEVAAVGF